MQRITARGFVLAGCSGVRALGVDVDLQTQRVHHLHHCGKAGVAFFAQGFVQALAGQPRVFGQLHHAACAGNVTKGFGKYGGIVRRLLQAGLQVGGAVFVRLQILRSIKGFDA